MPPTPYLTAAPAPGPRLRVLCFPHAGGAASAFAAARASAPAELDLLPIQLPGREGRLRHPPVTDMPTLIAELDVHLSPYLDAEYALYGHSMGALLAYHLTLRRARRGARLPAVVVLGACRPPHRPPIPLLGNLSDDELRTQLLDLGGLLPELRSYPDWMAAALALVRADLALCATADAADHTTPLPCPLDVVTGASDPVVSELDAREWAGYSTVSFRAHTVPGGHFFVRESQAAFLDVLGDALGLSRL